MYRLSGKARGVDNTPKKTTYGVSPIKDLFLEIYLLNARRELSVSLQNGALEVLGLEGFLRVLSFASSARLRHFSRICKDRCFCNLFY